MEMVVMEPRHPSLVRLLLMLAAAAGLDTTGLELELAVLGVAVTELLTGLRLVLERQI
jgi:hypothetical protein